MGHASVVLWRMLLGGLRLWCHAVEKGQLSILIIVAAFSMQKKKKE